MNSNTIKVALMLMLFLFGGLFLTQWIVLLPEFYQLSVSAVLLIVFLTILIKPSVGLDIKLIFLVCLGYAAGGKGFAYVSPVEPIYISEICLVLAMIGFLMRMWGGGSKFFYIKGIGLPLIITLLVYGGLRLTLWDFPQHGILAIRDSCTIYYAIFTFCIILACRNDHNFNALKKLMILIGPFGLIGGIAIFTGFSSKLHALAPFTSKLFNPHSDIVIPCLCATAATAFLKGIVQGKLMLILYAVLCMAILACSKTAAVFCLVILFGAMIFFTGRRELLSAAFFCGLFLFVVISVLVILQVRFEYTSTHLDTFGEVTDLDLYSGEESTTEWRLAWWRMITEDVMEQAPMMGMGFGGDITTRFFEETYDIEISTTDGTSAGMARYPHNIFFTVLGRLGIPGCILFTLMQFNVFSQMCKIMNKFFRQKELSYPFFMAVALVVAGIANSFVQMTYEGPYAAIPHWVALGFIYGYLQRLWKGLEV